jgi:formate dehydrogenase subunit gamma
MQGGRVVKPIWSSFAALVVTLGLLVGPAFAQADGMTQEGTGSNPTAQSVNEQQLLQELQKIEGRVSIPNTAAGLLQQPQGRDYRAFHESVLPWIAGIAIIGMLAVLALFYFSKAASGWRTARNPA